MEIGDGFQAEFFKLLLCNNQAGCSSVILLACITSGDDPTFQGTQGCHGLGRRIGTIAFIMIEDDRVALSLGDADGHQFIVKQTICPCCRRALMLPRCICVAGFTTDVMIFRQIFGRLNHTTDHAKALDGLAHQPAARQPVM